MAARHPKYLMEVLSVSEWEDWKAFYHLYPFGDEHVVMMLAKVWEYYINSNLPEGAERANIHDLLPGKDAKTRWEEIEELMAERAEERRQELAEKRRLSKMTQEEINAEAEAQWEREHAARFGRTIPESE